MALSPFYKWTLTRWPGRDRTKGRNPYWQEVWLPGDKRFVSGLAAWKTAVRESWKLLCQHIGNRLAVQLEVALPSPALVPAAEGYPQVLCILLHSAPVPKTEERTKPIQPLIPNTTLDHLLWKPTSAGRWGIHRVPHPELGSARRHPWSVLEHNHLLPFHSTQHSHLPQTS